MKVTVYIEGERLDLFQDESITITQGVQDVRDISKLFADFSQTFTVPASDNNNRIFKHYYNADIDGGFDARTRKLATIDVNTLDFKRGKIQLESVEIKQGKAASYKITFFGDAIKIKDLLGEDKLFDLDWVNNFSHEFTGAKVKEGLTTGLDFTVDSVLYENAIIYPLTSYTRQYLYNSNPSDSTNTDTLVNIAYDAGRSFGVRYNDLKPSIRLDLLIKAIEVKYPEINFTGNFFDSNEFQGLYMALNNSTSEIISGDVVVETIEGTVPDNVLGNIFNYFADITPKPGFETVPYKVRLELNDTIVFEHQTFVTGTSPTPTNINGVKQIPSRIYKAKCTVISNNTFEFDIDTTLIVRTFLNQNTTLFTNSYVDQEIDFNLAITSTLYDIKVYDFLTSLFKMFNLVVIPDGTDLLVEDLQSWYADGRIIDVTKYIDTTKLTVTKGRIFNRFNFLFEDSEQIIADEYFRNNRRYYGNLELDIYTDDTETELLDGEALDIEVIFENPVNERINDQDDNSQTNIQYCPYFDRELKSISGNPFLYYPNLVSVASNTIGFNDENDVYTEISGSVFMPSHSLDIDDTESFACNFSAELSEYTFSSMLDNIYSRYYQDYVSDIFSIKRRNFKLEAILPNELLHNLKLNDRLVIEDRRYLINRVTSNLVKRKDSFELINDIYDAPLAAAQPQPAPGEVVTADNTIVKADNTLITVDNG